MNPALIAFIFGVVVGVLGGFLLIGLLFLFREETQESKIEELATAEAASGAGVGEFKTAPERYQRA